MKDSEDKKTGKKRSRQGTPPGEPRQARPSSVPRPVKKPIPGTLAADGTPKKQAPEPRKTGTAGSRSQSRTGTSGRNTGQTGRTRTGTSTRKAPSTSRPGTARRTPPRATPSRGKSTRTTAKRSPEEQALAAQKKRLIRNAVIAVIIIVAIVIVGFVVRGELTKREEKLVSQQEDTSYDVVPCEPGILDMTLRRTGSVAGGAVSFGIDITNTSEQTCSLDAGSEHLVLQVTSGNDPIWSSAHCPAGEGSVLYVFGPGVSSTIDVHWSGARSNAECAGGLPAPRPGTYVVEGSVDGVSFPDLRESFTLTDASGAVPAPEPTEEATEEGPVEESTSAPDLPELPVPDVDEPDDGEYIPD